MGIGTNGQDQGNTASSFSHIAPKDIFERCRIYSDLGSRLELVDIKETNGDKKYILKYMLSDTIQLSSFISVLKAFETDKIGFASCMCHGYDKDDHHIFYEMNEIEDLCKLDQLFFNPCISFEARFFDRKTNQYRFSLNTDINSNALYYSVKYADLGKPLRIK